MSKKCPKSVFSKIGHGGGKIKRKLFFAMLVITCLALLSVSNVFATTENLNIPVNTSENIENATLNSTIMEDTREDTTNSTQSNEHSYDTQNSTTAAGGETYDDIHGVWLWSSDIGDIDVNALKNAGITDIFVFVRNTDSTSTYQTILNSILAKLEGTGIGVHAWITCFKDANGNWVDPQGIYSYTVQLPYTEKYQSWYKSWYKKWYKKGYKSGYKYRGRWRYRWRYYWTYYWAYTWKYSWAYRTAYRTETRYGQSSEHIDKLINTISEITKNYNIDGIHLDYVRYSGVGENAAYKHPGGTEAITNFVQKVYNTVKTIKPAVAVSAALMPEKSVNAYYYGQDYGQLSQYLDFLVPMIYKGNYGQDTNWIASTTKYIVEHSNGKPVIAGIQTYKSDSAPTKLSSDELKQDIQSAVNNGASGYVLFRYGLIDENFLNTGYSVVPTGPPVEDSVQIAFDEIKNASTNLKAYVESNGKLPEYVQISGKQISTAQFLKILIMCVLQLDKGITTPIELEDVDAAPDPYGDSINGNIYKAEYIEIAKNLVEFINLNGRAPNYGNSSLGKISFDYLVYNFSKIIDFYISNNRLPNYTIFESWRIGTMTSQIPAELLIYLQPTANCQSNDSRIISMANLLTAGITSTYEKATKIFEWVRDNCSYTFYYNTKYGAVEMLNRRNGNCIDHTHLIVALARAVGIPARYAHAQCEFTSMTVGHVWAELYVNGNWYTADATSYRNTFGTQNNCKILYWKGRYAELPF
ncbi:MAG: hypothetical protein FJ150_00430 [Euryarchaeota archaeon]|nr:hypothetical protein [Euryarchaeota archaeon]